jgi:hypothetical protein
MTCTDNPTESWPMEQLVFPAVQAAVRRTRPLPEPGDFAYGLVQAFDQALSNTGVVLLRSNELGLHLLAAHMIRPPLCGTSVEGSYDKASFIESGVRQSRQGLAAAADAVVYERVPVAGQRIESILLAGREIHRVTGGAAVMVDNRHAKAVLVGRAGTREDPVTKAHVKEAVERYIAPPGGSSLMPWNEHIRDAAMLGLAYLYDKKKQATA